MEVSVREAKANLSKLLKRATLGEEIVITKAGKPCGEVGRHREYAATLQSRFRQGRIRGS